MSRLVEALKPSTPGLAVRPFSRSEAFVVSHSSENTGLRRLTVADDDGAPCGFILHMDIEGASASPADGAGTKPLRLERQPFVTAQRAGLVRLTLTLDRVPLGAGAFFQPPPFTVECDLRQGEGKRRFVVDLTPPGLA